MKSTNPISESCLPSKCFAYPSLKKYVKDPGMKAKVIARRKETSLLSKHKYWGSQPAMQYDDLDNEDLVAGPIKQMQVKDVQTTPCPLPEDLEWTELDVKNNEKDLQEVYELLRDYYIEDYDSGFRMKLSAGYLKWAFAPPGSHKEWAVGARSKETKELILFANIAPTKVSMAGKVIDMGEASLGAMNTKYRSKRLSPLVFAEIIRRLNLRNVWQFFMSTDRVTFAPFSEAWFYRRELDFKTMVEVGLSKVPEGSTLEKEAELANIPEAANVPGMREMAKDDVPQVHALLANYVKKFTLYQIFTDERVEHMLLPKKDIVYTYVVPGPDGKLTDFVSFYVVPYSVLKHETIKEFKVSQQRKI